MKKKSSLVGKITYGVGFAGLMLMIFGAANEYKGSVLTGLALAFIGFFAYIVSSMIVDVNRDYSSRSDPYQKKMRVLRYIGIIAGCISFLSVGLVMYGLYNADNGAIPLMDLGLVLILVGILVNITVSMIAAVMRKLSERQPQPAAASPVKADIPYSADPVISRILSNPYVLLDERIRQIHEVQNLLQYPEIQRVFFEPAKLPVMYAQKRVEELLNIVRGWIEQNNAEEIFAAAESRRPVSAPAQSNNFSRKSSVDKSTVVGVVIVLIFWAFAFSAIVSVVIRSFK